MSANSLLLSASDIRKTFVTEQSQEPLVVLDGISIDLPAAKIISIVGSSGSGKSTLLHIRWPG